MARVRAAKKEKFCTASQLDTSRHEASRTLCLTWNVHLDILYCVHRTGPADLLELIQRTSQELLASHQISTYPLHWPSSTSKGRRNSTNLPRWLCFKYTVKNQRFLPSNPRPSDLLQTFTFVKAKSILGTRIFLGQFYWMKGRGT